MVKIQTGMSLGWPIQSVALERKFWTDYIWETEIKEAGYEGLEPLSESDIAKLRQLNVIRNKWSYCRLDVPLATYRLRLQFDAKISEVNLALVDSTGKAFQLGWDDQAHWHPHVLRCEELDVICRCIAKQDFSLPHPGVPLLLFWRFAMVTDSEDGEGALSRLREAWRSLQLFSEEEIGRFLRFQDFRGTGVTWQRNGRNWWMLHLDRERHPRVGLYTLRCAENTEFPFAQLEEALNNAREFVKGA